MNWASAGLSWTNGQTIALTMTAATAPDRPTGLTATANGETEIKLSWTAPTNNGSEAISGYKVEASANGTSGWSNVVADTASTDTTYSHTGLSAGNTRHYRVSAINSTGTRRGLQCRRRHHRGCQRARQQHRPERGSYCFRVNWQPGQDTLPGVRDRAESRRIQPRLR